MKKKSGIILTLLVLVASLFSVKDSALAQTSECKIQSSENHIVSLGFPMRKERLSNIDNPKILVIPFQLSDEPDYIFKDSFKTDYQAASDIISDLSLGKVKVDFRFANPITTILTNVDMENQKATQQSSWMTDPEKSTWGLVRRLIKSNDATIDFRGFNAVILEGSTTSRYADINEAMSFQDEPQNPWFKSVQTDEGLISNAILLDNHAYPSIIAHEVLHLFGLTDLYGSGAGPGRLTLMSNMENSLLTFEKWVLGWHPDSRVTCITNPPAQGPTEVKIDLNLGGHLAIIPTTLGSGYILDISKHKNSLFLSFYLLNNELRPPMQLFQPKLVRNQEGLPLADVGTVGQVLRGPEFSAIITDLKDNMLTVSILRSSNLESTEGQKIIGQATENIKSANPYVTPQTISITPIEPKAVDTLRTESQNSNQSAKPAGVQKKKTSIFCTKGKSTLKVTNLQPKCPSGYKIRK